MNQRFALAIVRFRLPLIIAANVITTFAAYIVAIGLRLDFDPNLIKPYERFLVPGLLLIFFRHTAYTVWNLNKGYWRYASTQDLLSILKAHTISSLCLASSLLILGIFELPRSVLFIEFAVSILFSGGIRLFTRLAAEHLFIVTQGSDQGDLRDVIVVGAGDSGHLLVKNILSHKRLYYRPVAVLDDSERLIGSSVFGVPVTGTLSSLEECLVRFKRVSAVIIAIPTLSNTRSRQIEATCKEIGIAVKKLQSFEDLACIDAATKHEAITIESVLEKQIDVAHESEISSALRNKTILVTGAGGSIGSELVRQILPFSPKSLITLDNSEYNLFKLNRELNGGFPSVRRIPIIGNIVDTVRLNRLFEEFRPEVVFHAAAYKHVPLMEENCYEAFLNNVVGTKNLLDVSVQYGVNRFVMISSDKAVAPSSVMGCSKLLAEMVVQCYAKAANRSKSGHPINTAIVRFGNVINSTGSVIPIFKEQILSGGPITVTHPEMERYFMSIREAVRLVLTAGTLGENGDVYILDMGRPIKIVEVARKMLALYGRRDCEIVFTGIRPGEKLSEELINSAELRGSTRFDKVHRVENFTEPKVDMSIWVNEVQQRLSSLSDNAIRELMFDIARGVGQESVTASSSYRAVVS